MESGTHFFPLLPGYSTFLPHSSVSIFVNIQKRKTNNQKMEQFQSSNFDMNSTNEIGGLVHSSNAIHCWSQILSLHHSHTRRMRLKKLANYPKKWIHTNTRSTNVHTNFKLHDAGICLPRRLCSYIHNNKRHISQSESCPHYILHKYRPKTTDILVRWRRLTRSSSPPINHKSFLYAPHANLKTTMSRKKPNLASTNSQHYNLLLSVCKCNSNFGAEPARQVAVAELEHLGLHRHSQPPAQAPV